MRFITVRGADRYHTVRIAGIGNAKSGVTFVRTILGLKALVPEISGCGDHDDAALHKPFTFVANRRPATSEVSHVVRN